MKKIKKTFVVIIVIIFSIPINVTAQNHTCSTNKHLSTIIGVAVKEVSNFLHCLDKDSEEKGIECFVYLRKRRNNKSIQFSIERFPIDNRSIEMVDVIGYYNFENNRIFIAIDKGEKISFEGIKMENVNQFTDSIINSYNAYNWSGTIVTGFYYYYFNFKFNAFSSKKGKLTYRFYPNYRDIPDTIQGNLRYYESSIVRFEDDKIYGNIFYHICKKYSILPDDQKAKFHSGMIKVRL